VGYRSAIVGDVRVCFFRFCVVSAVLFLLPEFVVPMRISGFWLAVGTLFFGVVVRRGASLAEEGRIYLLLDGEVLLIISNSDEAIL